MKLAFDLPNGTMGSACVISVPKAASRSNFDLSNPNVSALTNSVAHPGCLCLILPARARDTLTFSVSPRGKTCTGWFAGADCLARHDLFGQPRPSSDAASERARREPFLPRLLAGEGAGQCRGCFCSS